MTRVATAVFFLTQLPCSVFSRFCTSVCHILLTGREVTLPCAYRRTCFDIYKTRNSFNYFRLKNKTLVFEISIFYCFTGGAVCVCVFVCVLYHHEFEAFRSIYAPRLGRRGVLYHVQDLKGVILYGRAEHPHPPAKHPPLHYKFAHGASRIVHCIIV